MSMDYPGLIHIQIQRYPETWRPRLPVWDHGCLL